MSEPSIITAPRLINPFDRLPRLAEFLDHLASAASVEPDSPGEETSHVSEIKVDLPIELNLLQERGVWQLDASPPTQKVETTVMPVWHRLKLRVTLDDGGSNLDPMES